MKEHNRINKKVKIFLGDHITFTGIVLSEDDIFLTILDKFQKQVSLNKKHIVSIEEVLE